MRYHQPEWGLTTTARGGFVLVHQEQRFQEWSLRGAVRLSSDPAGRGSGAGHRLLVGHGREWRANASGRRASRRCCRKRVAAAGRLDAELGLRRRCERIRQRCAAGCRTSASRLADEGPDLPCRRPREPWLVVQREPPGRAPRELRGCPCARRDAAWIRALSLSCKVCAGSRCERTDTGRIPHGRGT